MRGNYWPSAEQELLLRSTLAPGDRISGTSTTYALVVSALERADIPATVLKGRALAARSYRDLAPRPMVDVDVLVPVAMVDRPSTVLRGTGWEPRIGWQTGRRQLVFRMRKMVYYLRSAMEIPTVVLTGLAARRVSMLERLEYGIRDRDHRLFGELPTYAFNCFRGERWPLLAPPGYLQQAWGPECLKQVPSQLVERAMRRVRTALGSRSGRESDGRR